MPGEPYRFLGAIRRRVLDTPALLAVLPGGAFSGLGDANTPRPYAALTEISNVAHDWDTSHTRWVHGVVQATIHADTLELAAQVTYEFEQAFRPGLAALVVRGHDVRRVWCESSRQLPRDLPGLAASRDFQILVEVHAELVRFPT